MHYADHKTILSPNGGMNIYRGCTHGCIYCDSRSACYQMRHDFEDIEIKRDAVRILEEQLRRKRKPCMIGTGVMCDPYIHLEEELQITLTTYDEDLCSKIEPEISTTAQRFAVLEQMRSLWTMQRFSSA